jgi:hypothetical protein
MLGFVDSFVQTPAGPVPRVKTALDRFDLAATVMVRCGIRRYRYTVAPGLYAVGDPDEESEVLVTANFKLTFDHLRKELDGIHAWILVLDTRGINVWCAAGKGTFATRELVRRVGVTDLAKVVRHRRLIVPQLGATGVSAKDVKQQSGFRVVYGPVRASDIPEFLSGGRKADRIMRTVTFTARERLVLTPVEIWISLKPALVTSLVLLIVSGIGPGLFSLSGAWTRGLSAISALTAGMVSGAVLTPALLPLIPVREFALKGILSGALTALFLIPFVPAFSESLSGGLALFLFTVTVSSVLAMNFTGATPFTSPSGVEKEMKRYIPVQLVGLVLCAALWIRSAF